MSNGNSFLVTALGMQQLMQPLVRHHPAEVTQWTLMEVQITLVTMEVNWIRLFKMMSPSAEKHSSDWLSQREYSHISSWNNPGFLKLRRIRRYDVRTRADRVQLQVDAWKPHIDRLVTVYLRWKAKGLPLEDNLKDECQWSIKVISFEGV
jgi:hypothetical protein